MYVASESRKRATGGYRSPDLLITSQLLYQLSYSGFIRPNNYLQINLSMLRCETIDTISGYVKGRMFAPDYQIKSI